MYFRPNLLASMDESDSFNIHIWMISQLLPYTRTSVPPFALYIVATCYEKMLLRMNYRTCQALVKDLKNMKHIAFSQQSHPTSTLAQMNSDQELLSKLQKSQHGTKLLAYITTHRLKHDNFYNQKTCSMFHQLLCDLLDDFLRGLEELNTLQSSKATYGVDDIMVRVKVVAKIGTMLRMMVRGAAITKHLKVIEGRLSNLALSTGPDNNVDDEEVEFVEYQRPNTPKSKTYMELLELMVIYFDAIQILAHSVKENKIITSTGRFDIKVLFRSPPGNNEPMLIWQDLLRHKDHFPAIPRPSPSTEEFITFLTPDPDPSPTPVLGSLSASTKGKKKDDGVNPESVIQDLSNLRTIQAKNFDRSIEDIIGKMKKLKKCTSSGSDRYIEHINEKLKALKQNIKPINYAGASGWRLNRISEIIGMVRTLMENARLSEMLRKGTGLSTGVGAKGVTHCEAIVACYCHYTEGWNLVVSHFFPEAAHVFLTQL